MKLFSYIVSSIYGLLFYAILLLFHPLQWLGLKLFDYEGHKRVVDVMNWCLMKVLLVLGIRIKFRNAHHIPKGKSLIIVSNHQSMFDIPPISWYFRANHPKFVSKKELGRGLPSVSFNLRHGGSVLIDRKNPKHAIAGLMEFGATLKKNSWSGVIFPEGTRSRTGKPKEFSTNGLKMLVKKNPEALVVPITINHAWQMFRYGKFPFGLGKNITLDVHEPIMANEMPFNDLFGHVEQTITKNIIECQ